MSHVSGYTTCSRRHFSCIPFLHNEIYKRGGNSSMYAKPFTYVTQTGVEEERV